MAYVHLSKEKKEACSRSTLVRLERVIDDALITDALPKVLLIGLFCLEGYLLDTERGQRSLGPGNRITRCKANAEELSMR